MWFLCYNAINLIKDYVKVSTVHLSVLCNMQTTYANLPVMSWRI